MCPVQQLHSGDGRSKCISCLHQTSWVMPLAAQSSLGSVHAAVQWFCLAILVLLGTSCSTGTMPGESVSADVCLHCSACI